ncbi:hypothetical protein [Nocardioides baekrokdamisoli]|uniref:hypothetical protein n=1 Tax=Nocardioides baekrokdamisoli TaxID=1804624 RepID=UPI000F7B0124|nr:hypothetical protein [Nocardioides baekrokdamisoli]
MSSAPQIYRPHRALIARLLGTGILVLALLVIVATVVLTVIGAPEWVLVILVLIYIAAFAALAAWAVKTVWFVRLDEVGYRVRFVRGAGVRSAAWTDVAGLAATEPKGIPCLELTLNDGGVTLIPVEVLDADREQFVRDVREHLRATEPRLQP